jgi:Ca2+-binding EF-hand superfamily protein
MATLSSERLATLDRLFKESNTSGDGTMNAEEFQKMFFKIFKQELDEEEVDMMIDEWDANRTGELDYDEFLGMISRLVKLYESDWDLLLTFKALTGELMPRQFTIDQIRTAVDRVGLDTSKISVEEMVWVASACNRDCVETLTLLDVLTEVMVMMDPIMDESSDPKLPLPPMGHMCKDLGHDVQMATVVSVKSKKKPRGGHQTAPPAVVPDEKSCKVKAYRLIEEPQSSSAALLYTIMMTGLVLVSTVCLVLETIEDVKKGVGKDGWMAIELVLTIIFCAEYVVRYFACDALGPCNTWNFVSNPVNVCDLVACLPFFVEAALGGDDASEFRMLRMARLSRLARLSKTAYSKFGKLAGPIGIVLCVIFGAFYKERPDTKK